MINDRILIAYGSKHGATVEIAERIANVLRSHDIHAEALPADLVHELSDYRAVILGSAVYAGMWRKSAIQFLKIHEDALTRIPVWIFSSGPTGEGDPKILLDGWTLPKAAQPMVDRIAPKDVTVFGGALHPEKLNRVERWITKKVKAEMGDFRDWDIVEKWAESIVEELAPVLSRR